MTVLSRKMYKIKKKKPVQNFHMQIVPSSEYIHSSVEPMYIAVIDASHLWFARATRGYFWFNVCVLSSPTIKCTKPTKDDTILVTRVVFPR